MKRDFGLEKNEVSQNLHWNRKMVDLVHGLHIFNLQTKDVAVIDNVIGTHAHQLYEPQDIAKAYKILKVYRKTLAKVKKQNDNMDNYQANKDKKRLEKAAQKKIMSTSETLVNGLYEHIRSMEKHTKFLQDQVKDLVDNNENTSRTEMSIEFEKTYGNANLQ